MPSLGPRTLYHADRRTERKQTLDEFPDCCSIFWLLAPLFNFVPPARVRKCYRNTSKLGDP